MSYPKAVLFSKSIILGKNKKNFLVQGQNFCPISKIVESNSRFLYTWLHKVVFSVSTQTSQTQKKKQIQIFTRVIYLFRFLCMG